MDKAKKASESRKRKKSKNNDGKKLSKEDENVDKYEKDIENLLGRPRQTASLGNPEDFPTDIKEGLEDFNLDVEKMKVEEKVQTMRFRGDKKKKYVV